MARGCDVVELVQPMKVAFSQHPGRSRRSARQKAKKAQQAFNGYESVEIASDLFIQGPIGPLCCGRGVLEAHLNREGYRVRVDLVLRNLQRGDALHRARCGQSGGRR